MNLKLALKRLAFVLGAIGGIAYWLGITPAEMGSHLADGLAGIGDVAAPSLTRFFHWANRALN